MIDTYSAAVYWGPRRERVEACAERSAAFLACLARCDPALARWFTPGQSREEALAHEVAPDAASLREVFLADRDTIDDERRLGFSLRLWNGGDQGEEVVLSLYCGDDDPALANVCVLYTALYQSAVAERLLRVPPLTAVMRCMVSAWSPDWGVVQSSIHARDAPDPPANAPGVGWMVYLSRERGVVPALPPPARVVPVDERGSLIVATQERFSADNPAHVAAAERIGATLDAAGLRGPLR